MIVEDTKTRERFRYTLRTRARGAAFGLVLLISSFLGVVFFHCVPYLFVMFFMKPFLYRHLADEMIGSWIVYCVSLMELFLGMKVVITGDKVRPAERNLIIMNHRTRLDWMYFWSVLIRQSGVKTEKIILKSPLKKIPGPGWAMQVGAFIFIDRNWEKDKETLSKMMNYFSDLNHNTQVLIFPEGTDFTPWNKTRSDDFAKKNDWKPYDFCLHPRTTGFTHLTKLMLDNKQIDAVYDVTIGYPYNMPQNEPQFIAGNFPREVHFHIKRHPIDTLPSTENDLQTWCQQRWAEKEERLRNFYINKKFEESSGSSGGDNESNTRDVKLQLVIALIYWTLFIIGISILLWYSWLARWFVLAQIVFFLYMGHKRGGFELFQADYFNWFFNTKKRV